MSTPAPAVPAESGPAHVVAVVVAHDGIRWLPAVRSALDAQTVAPDVVVAADTASTDGSADLLSDWVGPAQLARVARDTGYGGAVTAALATAPRTPAGRTGWVWLLHDDLAPQPDALRALLAEAGREPSTAVLGPKLRGWTDRRLLLEVGLTIARSGRRETLLERREHDQGQHDGNRGVLAVNTAGMLVRRDVWEELGGLDPELALLRDDVDFGWRANLAGHRVAVVTDAVAHHAQAGASGRRPPAVAPRRPHRLDRRNANYVLLANLPVLHVLPALLSLTVGTLLRALGYLVGKRPGHALDELAALAGVVGRPLRLLRARRRRRRTRRVPARRALPLLAPRSAGVRHLLESGHVLLGARAGTPGTGRHRALTDRRSTSAPATGPTSEADEDLPSWSGGLVRRLVLRPSVVLAVAMTLLGLLAGRTLLGDGRLLGGALLPAPDGAGDLWRTYVASWHPVGVGSDTEAPPYLAVLAGVALLLGSAERAVDLLLLGAVPLSAMSAYVALRRVVATVPLRVWAAVTYALLPPVLGAVAAGRLGTAALAVLLPVTGLAVARALGGAGAEPDGSDRSVWAAALLLAVSAAFVPLTAVVVLGLALLGLPLVRGRARRARLALLALVPPVLLLPWLPEVVGRPGLLLQESGLPGPGLSERALPALDLLLLRPGGPGLPPVLLTAAVVLAALAGLLRPDRRRPVLLGWLLALAGLVAAAVLARVSVVAPAVESAVPAWPGPALVLAGAGLVLAAAVGAEGAGERLAGRNFGWRQPVAAVVALGAALAPLALSTWWVADGAGGPLRRDDPVLLPAFVAAEGTQPARPRTLVLRSRPDGRVAYALLRSEGPRTGDAEVVPAGDGGTRLARVVADLASGRGGDAAARLVPYGIRFVLLARPVQARVARAVEAVPGIVQVSDQSGSVLWRVDYPSARVRLLPPGSPVVSASGAPPPGAQLPARPVGATAQVPAGSPGRLLVLAEPRDPGWQARVDGAALPERTYAGWAQAFLVPAEGGRLQLGHEDRVRGWLVGLQLAAVLLTALLALPSLRTPEDAVDDEEGP